VIIIDVDFGGNVGGVVVGKLTGWLVGIDFIGRGCRRKIVGID
jgi:hypothetical protein